MLKVRANLRKVAAIAACLAAITVFSGCDEEDDPNDDNGKGKPETVMNLTATAGNRQVSLSWDAPSKDGGSEITGYEATMDNWANKVTKTASERSHTYTDLTNGTEYTFKVRAVNAEGTGAESTATATPTEGGGTSNWEYTLPQNLKLSYTFGEGSLIRTVIKVGNNYYTEQKELGGENVSDQMFFKDNGNGTWTLYYYVLVDGWVLSPNTNPWNETELFKKVGGLESFPFYWQILSLVSTLEYTTQTGTGTVCGRSVNIHEDIFGTNICYVDTQYNMILKCSTNIELEVVEWDETITDFGELDIP